MNLRIYREAEAYGPLEAVTAVRNYPTLCESVDGKHAMRDFLSRGTMVRLTKVCPGLFIYFSAILIKGLAVIASMRTQTKETQEKLTPELALEILKNGNARFVNNIKSHRNLLQQVNETSSGQFPFACVLSCIDSRTSAELIFDQGLGDIFSIRIAGNILNEDILGSMEFACKIAGSKLIVVLGHTKCGAIEAACNNVKLGHITPLLDKLKPAIDKTKATIESGADRKLFLYSASVNNVALTIQEIKCRSIILNEMEQSNQIKIVGGLYDIDTGIVFF